MNRRAALKLLCKLGFFSLPILSRAAKAMGLREDEWIDPDLVLIVDSDPAKAELHPLVVAAAEASLDADEPDWRARLTVWNARSDAKQVKAFLSRYGANTTALPLPVLVSVPAWDAEEVRVWSPEWLGEYEKKAPGKCYPISGHWWSVDGDWHPTREKVKTHLFESPNHTGGQFELTWLEQLVFAELQSLHSDHHREMTHHGKVHWDKVNHCPA